jgi:hypothetical protein
MHNVEAEQEQDSLSAWIVCVDLKKTLRLLSIRFAIPVQNVRH